jgi:hypothetical protein
MQKTHVKKLRTLYKLKFLTLILGCKVEIISQVLWSLIQILTTYTIFHLLEQFKDLEYTSCTFLGIVDRARMCYDRLGNI